MPTVITGIVREGKVIPSTPLPEGASVHITVTETPLAIWPELQEEFDDWNEVSNRALENVEGLIEGAEDEAR